MATGFTSPRPVTLAQWVPEECNLLPESKFASCFRLQFQFPGDNFAAGSDFHTVFNPLAYSNNRGLVPKGPFRDPLERQNVSLAPHSCSIVRD